jgi:hypothetical protein
MITDSKIAEISLWSIILSNPAGRAVHGVYLCRSLAGIASSEPPGGIDDCLSRVQIIANVVGCPAEVTALGSSLAQRSPTERGVSKGV